MKDSKFKRINESLERIRKGEKEEEVELNNAYGIRDFKKKYLDNIPGIYQNSVEQLARRGAVVINGSPRSIVKCFQKTSPQKAINWILNENVKG